MTGTILVPIRPLTNAERQRRHRQRRRQTVTADRGVTRNEGASFVTVSTANMCALAARLEGGAVTPADLRLASKIILRMVLTLPPDSTITIEGRTDE